MLMPAYLFIVALHFFFIPSFRENRNTTGKSVCKTNSELAYYLVRNDRSTFSESKNIKTVQKKKPHCGALVSYNLSPAPNSVEYSSFHSQFPHDHHHSWLSNRVLRI